jgi:hypothetical protein
MMDKTIYDLNLHESMYMDEKHPVYITRVPGGWIYWMQVTPDEGNDCAVFVPYSDEFQKHF